MDFLHCLPASPPNETKIRGTHIIGIYYLPGYFVVRAQMDVARNRKKNK